MIDSKELMLGNWVQTIDGYERVIGITHTNIFIPDGKVNYKDVAPIVLTPEILEKAGFVEYKDIKNNIHAKNGAAYYIQHNDYRYVLKRMWHENPNYSVSIEYTDSPFSKDDGQQYVFSFDIQYLHQFQNLFYSLTQTELNIQL